MSTANASPQVYKIGDSKVTVLRDGTIALLLEKKCWALSEW